MELEEKERPKYHVSQLDWKDPKLPTLEEKKKVMDTNDLVNRFSYHAPKNEYIKENHELIRRWCLNFSKAINEIVPEGREKALAITHLEEVMMWANAGIARNNE